FSKNFDRASGTLVPFLSKSQVTLLNLLSLLCSVLDTTLIKIQQIDVKNKEQIYQREKGAL
ncbi:hypothetical protein, partial [Xenorhabdus bovienii]